MCGGGLLVQLEDRGGIAMAGYLALALRPAVVLCHMHRCTRLAFTRRGMAKSGASMLLMKVVQTLHKWKMK